MTALAAALTGLLLALAAVAEADTDAADGNATAPRPGSVPNQGFGRHAGVSSLAVRAKESDDFSALASEKPAEPAPAKREAWKGFGREMSNGDDEVQMQGESASWNVLNHIGVETMLDPMGSSVPRGNIEGDDVATSLADGTSQSLNSARPANVSILCTFCRSGCSIEPSSKEAFCLYFLGS
ncbi:hypothetical protein GUJ93_ZPchr0005g15290 [Zizania palustris]|uniref:Uncharacterized protein n=1 Tax=Zizania palustris TaxID=103762 RepID=A0A8J5VI27_ZIZPA|nr:hypothetical protein GUJ93_ZPchr0005g15290 [Zizania palustris]